EIGSPEHALASGGRGCSFVGEQVVGIARAALLSRVRPGTELISEPAQGQACRLGDARDMPAAGNGVAKRVQASLRVERGAVGSSEDHAGGADGGAHRSGTYYAHSRGSSCLIAGSGDDWSSRLQARSDGSLGGNL